MPSEVPSELRKEASETFVESWRSYGGLLINGVLMDIINPYNKGVAEPPVEPKQYPTRL